MQYARRCEGGVACWENRGDMAEGWARGYNGQGCQSLAQEAADT
jgi:hypothetical protein